MDLNEEIARIAYELFERDGGEHGKDREHWLEAERIVRARHADNRDALAKEVAVLNKPKRTPAKKDLTARDQEKTSRTPSKTTAASKRSTRTTKPK